VRGWFAGLVITVGCGRFDFGHVDAMLVEAPVPPDGMAPACRSDDDCGAGICEGATAGCRAARHCAELLAAHPTLGDGAYEIDPDGAAGAAPWITFCDMTIDGGGWTLVGKTDGVRDMYSTWLVSDVNVGQLATTTIATGTYACVDAVELAVNGAAEVRLTNEGRTRWVRWPLPAGRTTATFWNHAIGYSAVVAAVMVQVSVTSEDASVDLCFQNAFGILPADLHGGSYPYTSFNAAGNTGGGDNCMSVGVQLTGMNADSWGQNGNGFDAPSSDADWPNAALASSMHVAVWLR
jgi:hypothetical protein